MNRVMRLLRSVAIENILVFVTILLLTVLPLAYFYLKDTQQNLVDILSANVTVAAKRGADQLNAGEVAKVTSPHYLSTPQFDDAVAILRSLQQDFSVDNAVLYRWDEAQRVFVYIADGFGQFEIGSPVHIHSIFPATFQAAQRAWQSGAVDDTRLFESGDSMFFQTNFPLKQNGKVVAALLLNDDATRVAQQIRIQQRLIVFGTITVMLVGALAFWAVTTIRMRPLVRLTGAAGAIAAGDLEIDVPTTGARNEIGELNAAFLKMVADLRASRREIEEYSRSLEIKVRERTREIRNLLDNMDEGILTMEAQGRMDAGYSSATEQMLGRGDVAGANFIDMVSADPAARAALRETFELLLGPEPMMAWEDLIENLPKEFQLEDARWLRVRFRPIAAESGAAIVRVMVILQDVTREKGLQADIDRGRAEQEMVVKVLQNRETFDLFYEDAQQLLATSREQVRTMTLVQRGIVDELFRGMHTIKGTSALFAMGAVAARAHELEEILREMGKMRDVPIPDATRDGLTRGLDEIAALLRAARQDMLKLIGEGEAGGTQLTISEEKIDRIAREVMAASGEKAAAIQPILAALKHVPAERLFNKYRGMVVNTAEKLGKSAALLIEGAGEAELPRELFREVDPMLLHLIRNAVDHGIEPPESRQEHGKPPQASIRLSVWKKDGVIAFAVADDGGGIDPERIRRAAVERGFLTAEQAQATPKNELIRFLFVPGFSTKAQVTDLSGRGVGLDVVRHEVEKLGGRLRLTTRIGAGSRFEMSFPYRA